MWTDEVVEELKTLWAEGHSASTVAAMLGAQSRSAVLGKLHRMGLSGRSTVIRSRCHVRSTKRKPESLQKPRISKRRKIHELPPTQEFKPVTGGVSFNDLEAKHCRFPITGEETREHLYCGCDKLLGLSYCEHHARIAYQPTPAPRPQPMFIERRMFRAFA